MAMMMQWRHSDSQNNSQLSYCRAWCRDGFDDKCRDALCRLVGRPDAAPTAVDGGGELQRALPFLVISLHFPVFSLPFRVFALPFLVFSLLFLVFHCFSLCFHCLSLPKMMAALTRADGPPPRDRRRASRDLK